MSFHKKSPPDIVVFPTSAEEVQAVVKAAYDANVPVVPRGAGSGLEGGAIPYQGGIVLDLMRMKAFKIYEAEMQCEVQAGMKKSELNAKLEPYGMLFGPDPASNPSVGGMVFARRGPDFEHFSIVSQLDAARHTMCAVFLFVSVFIEC